MEQGSFAKEAYWNRAPLQKKPIGIGLFCKGALFQLASFAKEPYWNRAPLPMQKSPIPLGLFC